ncbi:transcription factor e(y)2-domain-containing protein [Cyathus striatus]|nr:transcription factor e(y)2-domain-containing protein [Cyathus striatus]
MPAADVEVLYTQLRRRMMESGEWDHIQSILTAKLNESGWLDEVKDGSKEKARVMEPLSFQQLFEETTSKIASEIPLSIKREIMSHIRQYIIGQTA